MSKLHGYLLNTDNLPYQVSIEEWAENVTSQRHISNDTIPFGDVDLRLSTVFLGMDYGFTGTEPLLFETMLFVNGEWDELYMERYTSYEDALVRHNELKSILKDVSKEIKTKGLSVEEWVKENISKGTTLSL